MYTPCVDERAVHLVDQGDLRVGVHRYPDADETFELASLAVLSGKIDDRLDFARRDLHSHSLEECEKAVDEFGVAELKSHGKRTLVSGSGPPAYRARTRTVAEPAGLFHWSIE
jgi:hypothetical protein